MKKKSTSIEIFDLPRLENLNDAVTDNIQGGGITPRERLACTGLTLIGLAFAGPVGAILVNGACHIAADEL